MNNTNPDCYKKYMTKLNERFIETCEEINDEDLDDLIEFYTKISNLIDCLGLEFGLQKKEIRLRLEKLESFKSNRIIEKKRNNLKRLQYPQLELE